MRAYISLNGKSLYNILSLSRRGRRLKNRINLSLRLKAGYAVGVDMSWYSHRLVSSRVSGSERVVIGLLLYLCFSHVSLPGAGLKIGNMVFLTRSI